MSLPKLLRTVLAWFMFAVAELGFASPASYTMSFSGSVVGPQGTGSFQWDSTTSTLSQLSWNFGNGFAGGIADFALAPGVTNPTFSSGALLFNRVFQNSGNSQDAFLFPFSLGFVGNPSPITGTFPAESANAMVRFCWGNTVGNAMCDMAGGAFAQYLFVDTNGTVLAKGVLTATLAPVPEPGIAHMLLIGILVVGFAFRASRSHTSAHLGD